MIFSCKGSRVGLWSLTLLGALLGPADWIVADEKLPLPDYTLKTNGLTPSAECGKCHRDVYQAWERSLHARSVNNLVFRTAFLQVFFEKGEAARRECLFCHAPLTLFNLDFKLKQEVTREGVTCDFCHSIVAVDLESPEQPFKFHFGKIKQGTHEHMKSPAHGVEPNPLFQDARLCAACHSLRLDNGVSLIATYEEWKAGPYPARGKPCQSCHMPLVPGQRVIPELKRKTSGKIRQHDIAAGHALTKRPQSLKLKIASVQRYRNRLTVSVEVTNIGAGHKIPTGLPSKRLILQVTVSSRESPFRQMQEISYQRVLVTAEGRPVETDVDLLLGRGVRVASDNRIAPLETRREQLVFFVPDREKLTVEAAVFFNHNPEIIQVAPINIPIKETRQLIED